MLTDEQMDGDLHAYVAHAKAGATKWDGEKQGLFVEKLPIAGLEKTKDQGG